MVVVIAMLSYLLWHGMVIALCPAFAQCTSTDEVPQEGIELAPL
jgi:hypothetical protein